MDENCHAVACTLAECQESPRTEDVVVILRRCKGPTAQDWQGFALLLAFRAGKKEMAAEIEKECW